MKDLTPGKLPKIMYFLFLIIIGLFCTPTVYALTATEVYKQNEKYVYTVFADGDDERKQGSGVAVTSEKYGSVVITNCHVVQRSKKVRVVGVAYAAPVEVVYCSESGDLAVLRTSEKLPAMSLVNRKINVGEAVYAIGSPRGYQLSLSEGVVSQQRSKTDDSTATIQTTVAIEPGSSGGGLFDGNARLIGITSSKIKNSQGLNFAIPLEEVIKVADVVDGKFKVLNASKALKAQYQLSKWDVRGFKLGQHCSDQLSIAKALEKEGLTLAYGKEEPFCSEMWDKGQAIWSEFGMDRGKVYRKLLLNVIYDEVKFVNEIDLTDAWFYGHDVKYPDLRELMNVAKSKYGEPDFSGTLEERQKGLFSSRERITRSEILIYMSEKALESVQAAIVASKVPFDAEKALSWQPGESMIIEIYEIREIDGALYGLGLRIKAKKKEVPQERPEKVPSSREIKF